MGRRRDKAEERRIAERRIHRLLDLAQAACREDRVQDAQRYGQLAWRLKQRYVLATPPRLKRHTCRACHVYHLPSRTARTRLTGAKVTTTCLVCGHVDRTPYVAEQKAKRRQGSPATGDR